MQNFDFLLKRKVLDEDCILKRNLSASYHESVVYLVRDLKSRVRARIFSFPI